MPQEQTGTHGTAHRTTEAQEQAVPNTQAGDSIDELDAILDDIESVLETNAEEYVRGFVQKGGQ